MTLLVVGAPLDPAHAQDALKEVEKVDSGITYEVAFPEDLPGTLGKQIERASQLQSLSEKPPEDALALIRRAEADLDRFEAVLAAEGFYQGRVELMVEGRPLGGPDALEAARFAIVQRRPVQIAVAVQPGAQFVFGDVAVEAWPKSDELPAITARTGNPARFRSILETQGLLERTIAENGFPFARVERPPPVVDHATRKVALNYRVSQGPQADMTIGKIEGLAGVDRAAIDTPLAAILEGKPFAPSKIDKATDALLALEVFQTVDLRPAEQLDGQGRVPILLDVAERKPRTFGFDVGFSSLEGMGGQVYWQHRNLFGQAEKLRVDLGLGGVGDGSITEPDLNAGVTYAEPNAWGYGITPGGRFRFEREKDAAFDRDSILLAGTIDYVMEGGLTLNTYLELEQAEVTERQQDYSITSLNLGGRVDLDKRNDLLEPTDGYRLNGDLALIGVVAGDTKSFVRAGLTGTGYWALKDPPDPTLDPEEGGMAIPVLAGRLGYTALLGADADDVAADRRLYAGGPGSVRGFALRKLGPRDESGEPLGGASRLEASIEWRQPIAPPWGAAAFVDAGGVGRGFNPLEDDGLGVAIGGGVRYSTPLGPIRADIAFPIVTEDKGAGLVFYVGIGQAF